MKKLIGFIFICISVMTMSGCILNLLKDDSESTPSIIKSEDIPIQVEVPEGWEVTSKGELNEEADLEVANLDESLFFIALMEDKRDLTVDLEGYRDIVVQMNEESYETSLNESIKTKVGEYDAYLNEFDIVSDSSNYHLWLFSVETDHYFGQLFAWTLVSQAEDNEDEIMGIINSFTETQEDTAD